MNKIVLSPQTNQGIMRIVKERMRQVLEEKFTAQHDDEHDHGELAKAAVCYASPLPIYVASELTKGFQFSDPWPWSSRWDKRMQYGENRVKRSFRPTHPCSCSLDERIDLLTKAGALIAAEIDRLLRIRERTERE